MIIVTCQHTGLQFEARSARSKNHPDVAAILADANKRGCYGAVVQAFAEARESGITGEDALAMGKEALRGGIEASNAFADRLRAQRKQRAAERAQERKDFYDSLDEEELTAVAAAEFVQPQRGWMEEQVTA